MDVGESGVKIVLVGHCMPDAYAMRSALGRTAEGADFVFVNDEETFRRHLDADAFLINRALDGRFETGLGVDLIESLPPETRSRAALISEHADAQAAAVAAGALPGFGKRGMYGEPARACILSLLGRTD